MSPAAAEKSVQVFEGARAFERFATMLRERLDLGVLTTEDSIRYTFYTALLSSGNTLAHTDVVLEHPHPAIPGAKIDPIIRGVGSREPIALEFKYDGRIPEVPTRTRLNARPLRWRIYSDS